MCEPVTSSCCPGERTNTPPLLPQLKLHWYKSHQEVLQTLKNLYQSSRIYFPLEYFLSWLFCEAPTWNGNKGAAGGVCRTGVSLSQPAQEANGPCELQSSWMPQAQLHSLLVFPRLLEVRTSHSKSSSQSQISREGTRGSLCWGISCRYSFVKQGLVFCAG